MHGHGYDCVHDRDWGQSDMIVCMAVVLIVVMGRLWLCRGEGLALIVTLGYFMIQDILWIFYDTLPQDHDQGGSELESEKSG